jgi:hypothetical protein
MDVHRLTAGGVPRHAIAALVLVATFLVCLWIGTYQDFAPVGIRGAFYTPVWALPVTVAVGVGGALVAVLIYRQGRRR